MDVRLVLRPPDFVSGDQHIGEADGCHVDRRQGFKEQLCVADNKVETGVENFSEVATDHRLSGGRCLITCQVEDNTLVVGQQDGSFTVRQLGL